MKVLIKSKWEFDKLLKDNLITDDNVEDKTDIIFISIVSSGELEKSYLGNEHKNYLRLKFDDLSDEEYEYCKVRHNEEHPLILFSEDDADRIIDFISLSTAKICIVHCSAGVSRSGAVGTFINDCMGGQSYFEFMESNPHIKPNSFILTTLRKTLQLRP